MDNQSEVVVGCILFVVLTVGAYLLGLAFIGSVIGAVNLQADLDSPPRHYLKKEPIKGTDLELNLAVPSKVVPGKPTKVMVWAVPDPAVTKPLLLTVSTRVQPPLFISGTAMITLTASADGIEPREFGYKSMNLDTREKKVTFEFQASSAGIQGSQDIDAESPLDTAYARRRILIDRLWWVLGLFLAALFTVGLKAAFDQ